jgi:riboflavin kinase/FMN adenylyltransferase
VRVQVIRAGDSFERPATGTAVTIGAYDGVHRGHQAVIASIRAAAAERGLESAVVTFDRHPASVVRPESAPLVLTDLEQKLELLEATGVDHVVVVTFDEERAAESAEDFVATVLVDQVQARLVVVGEDFHFGHQRRGNVALLRELGDRHGFEVQGLSLVGLDGRPARDHAQVSSTAIRRALAVGDLATANAMLTRAYEVRGVVESGDKRGRELGFPTANITVAPDRLLPTDGVYSGWYVRADGTRHATAISLGTRPHFYDQHGVLLLEAHLLDFVGDLYGEKARVQFVALVREQRAFASLDALIGQLNIDVETTRELLGL